MAVKAFRMPEISGQAELFVIEALRAARAQTLFLVTEKDGCVVGHIAFPPVTVSNGTRLVRSEACFGLAGAPAERYR